MKEAGDILPWYGGDGGLTTVETEAVDAMLTTEEEETMMALLKGVDEEEAAKEVWKFLESSEEKVKVKIIDNPFWLRPLTFQTAASYITINGNEESCGSSYSDSDASYMAGVSIGCGFLLGDGVDGGAWDVDFEETRGWLEAEGESVKASSSGGMNAGAGADANGEIDDDMLANFLGEDFGQKVECGARAAV